MQQTGATTLRLIPPADESPAPGERLAELVAHLTGCAARSALDAIDAALRADGGELSAEDRLGVVATAMVAVRNERVVDARHRRPA
jgi:hypothetical protein